MGKSDQEIVDATMKAPLLFETLAVCPNTLPGVGAALPHRDWPTPARWPLSQKWFVETLANTFAKRLPATNWLDASMAALCRVLRTH